ncbi:unnamed protein product [Strongylus vulgaris]|uniref:Uncharacterized protein n=1 Tax=Strongylus vulgaris TaxID=40348 RepID=A0A3P7J0P4_STRVU|nr:unnamed protein product [Strongylus vulgaris]
MNIICPPTVREFNSREYRIGIKGVIKSAAKRRLKKISYVPELLPYDWHGKKSEKEEQDTSVDEENSHQLTLGDFLTLNQPSASSCTMKSSSSKSEVTSSFEIVALKPSDVTDISSATNAPCIFEIIDVKLNNLDAFDLQEEIPLLAPHYCTVHWFGPQLVSVASKRSINPRFVLFFEVMRDMGLLRVRINTNARYTAKHSKNAFVKMLETRRNFPSLFDDAIEFIFRLDRAIPAQKPPRFTAYKTNFMQNVNSAMLTTSATRSDESDQLDLLRRFYKSDTSDAELKLKGNPVQPEYLEQKNWLGNLMLRWSCAEARRHRFDKSRRNDFKNAVIKKFTMETEQSEVIDMRKTVLLLVEHCMAWLYLHRHNNQDFRYTKKMILQLFDQFIRFQAGILNPG